MAGDLTDVMLLLERAADYHQAFHAARRSPGGIDETGISLESKKQFTQELLLQAAESLFDAEQRYQELEDAERRAQEAPDQDI